MTEDDNRVAMGQEPKYLANRYSQVGTVSLALNLTGPVEERTMEIKYPVPAISSSLITLEVAADSLKFAQNYSPGEVCIFFAEIIVAPQALLCHVHMCTSVVLYSSVDGCHDTANSPVVQMNKLINFLGLFPVYLRISRLTTTCSSFRYCQHRCAILPRRYVILWQHSTALPGR